MDNILNKSKDIKDWLIKVRRDFHICPELGMEEFKTSEKICNLLDEMGIEYQRGVANTGVVGLIKGAEKGKTVALRADMDALPILEKNDVSYKSKVDGKMHACGHDAHMTILLGTAKILNEIKGDIKGNIKLIFQPAEETVGGAQPMIEAGVMENPKVDAIFGLHVAPEIPVGKIGIKYDKMNASSDTLNIKILGESTHGAYPQSGIDSIMITAQVINALQSIVSRNISPVDSAVVSLGTINGGTQHNIIANSVQIRGTLRTLTPKTREMALSRIQNIVEGIPRTLGGRGEFIREEGYAALINHDDMVDLVKHNGEKLLGEENIIIINEPSLGVEDFAYFLNKAKGAYYRLGCRNEENGIIYDGHHDRFNIDEDCLPIGVAMQVSNVIKFLK
ncbi:amidohydrolase [Clostridium sp. D2Q-11]|uniref:Amidohydrolase n=1 Tax=Anaeromonas frigoriresistens TaxID=2683708 RepID=A0A942Z6D1_9FIRM|nr:M20 family metallopeptidase [Anaeromonas frigoriresistens]MBS4537457.1 amidohydrolase [Anaeromonas frigoriresistens]